MVSIGQFGAVALITEHNVGYDWLTRQTPSTSDFKKYSFKGIVSCWNQARSGVTVVSTSQLPQRQWVSLSILVLS